MPNGSGFASSTPTNEYLHSSSLLLPPFRNSHIIHGKQLRAVNMSAKATDKVIVITGASRGIGVRFSNSIPVGS